MNSLKIENVVFCDAIREEIGGKHTILGAFAPEINISTVPSITMIAIWLIVSPSKVGKFDCEILIKNSDQKEILKAKIEGEFNSLLKSSLALPQMPINVTKSGVYTFSIKSSHENKWKKFGEIKINHV